MPPVAMMNGIACLESSNLLVSIIM